jgi:DHA1 family inner membrane transport protein
VQPSAAIDAIEPGPSASARATRRRLRRSGGAAVVLLGFGAGYGGGNVGPAATAIGRSFGVSLSLVGLMMTVFFGAIAVVTVASAPLLRRPGPRTVIVYCCVVAAAGSAVCALSPSFGGVLLGRLLAGLGAGIAFVIGPVVARAERGARLVGMFGAAVTLGIAIALAVGSVLADAAADWRVGFWVSSVAAGSALVVLPRTLAGAATNAARPTGFITRALRTRALWRLMLLFITANGITLVVSTWLIAYLVRDGHTRPWLAGALGFVMFTVTAALRRVGGRLAESSPRVQRLAAGSPLLAGAGLAGLALDPSPGPALLWVLLMGAGFALPYALMIDRAQRLFPESPAGAIAMLQTGPNVLPMAIVPVVGAALDSGDGTAAFLALAAVAAVAALANAGRTREAVTLGRPRLEVAIKACPNRPAPTPCE